MFALYNNGITQKAIARQLRVRRETVSRILTRYRTTGNLSPGKSTGRPRISSVRQDRVLYNLSRRNRFKSASTLREEWAHQANVRASRATVNLRLIQGGYRARRPVKTPKLTARHRRARFAWAQQHQNLTVAHWQHVVFADESRFLVFPVDGRARVRRLAGEALLDQCTQDRVTGGGGSVHVWAAFCAHGRSRLVVLDQNVTAVRYMEILDQHLLPWARRLFGNNFRFQDDNAPAHRGRVVRDFLEQEAINVLYQPSLSPDCNPIEHLWDELGRAVRSRQNAPSNLHELRQALIEEWDRIDPDRLTRLVESMPRRLAEVVRSRGGPTRY